MKNVVGVTYFTVEHSAQLQQFFLQKFTAAINCFINQLYKYDLRLSLEQVLFN